MPTKPGFVSGIPADLYDQLQALGERTPTRVTPGERMIQGLSPTGSGTSLLSNEELARTERFYHVKPSGALTYLGKQPDANLRANEAVIAIGRETGKMRVVNSRIALSDMQVIDKYGHAITKAVMESGASQIAAGTGAVKKTVIRGARRMLNHL